MCKNGGKRLYTLVILAVIVICAGYMLLAETGLAYAEVKWECWVVCEPDSFVCIRSQPSLHGRVVGWMYAGDRVIADDHKGEWIHSSDLLVEAGEGWICMDYLSEVQPVDAGGMACVVTGDGRVAVREGIGGTRIGWLKPGTEITVYMVAGEWAVTDKGFVNLAYVGESGDD